MDYRPPEPARDAAAAGWIAPRLIDQFGAVCQTIPTGFPAYARLLHPADPGAIAHRRWAEVAESNGRTVHPLAQFARIARPPRDRAPRRTLGDVQAPRTGDLEQDHLRTLCAVLQAYVPDRSRCWFAVWEGWGEMSGATSVMSSTRGGGPAPAPRDAPAHWQLDLRAATFALPGRSYYLYTGPLGDALRIGHWVTDEWFVPRSPNLWWPDDRRWCVASEVDVDSTLVAGPTDLIDELVHRDDLEAWPVGPLDSLAWDGDEINQP